IASDLPAPEWPVITTMVTCLRLCSALTSTRPVELFVDLARQLARQPGHRLELLPARSHEALRGAEVLQQGSLANRAHAPKLVEDRARHRTIAAAAMVLDRE